MQVRAGLLALGLVVVMTGQASAQGVLWEDLLFVNVNFGVQAGSRTVEGSRTFSIYGEDAVIASSRKVSGGPFIDITAGMPLYGNLGAAVNYSLRSKDSDASVTGSIPDPIGFTFRPVSASATAMRHRETWLAPLAVWFVPAAEKVDVLAFGGPAIVWVEHEIVESATIVEGAPLSLPAQFNPTSRVAKNTVGGIVVGADARYLLTKSLGVGGFVKFTHASAEVAEGASVDLGGFQIGFGVRFRY